MFCRLSFKVINLKTNSEPWSITGYLNIRSKSTVQDSVESGHPLFLFRISTQLNLIGFRLIALFTRFKLFKT